MKPKILQICFGEGYAGSAKMALLASVLLQNSGYPVKFICTKKSLTSQRAKISDLDFVELDSEVNENELFNSLEILYLSYKPDVVISNHSLERKTAVKLKKKYKQSFINIAYRHNESKTIPIIGALIYNKYFEYSVACSYGVARSLEKLGIKKNKIKVIHYGIEIPDNIDSITGDIIKKQLNVDSNKIILGTSSWFHKLRKGFDILFKSLADLNESFILYSVGIPVNLQNEVINYALEFGVNKQRLIFGDYVENIWEHYKAMDIFLLPSRSEGFPLTMLESAASRVPIIASDIPGVNEFIVNEKNGLLFSLKNSETLKNAIMDLSNDRDKINSFRNNAYNDIKEKYTAKHYSENLDEFISSLF